MSVSFGLAQTRAALGEHLTLTLHRTATALRACRAVNLLNVMRLNRKRSYAFPRSKIASMGCQSSRQGQIFGGGFALTRWLHEISENRKLREKELLWKKKAALLDRITAFGDTPGAQNAMMMMSAPGERYTSLRFSPDPSERYVRVSWEEVAQAMMAEDVPLESKFSAIRDSFSDFFAPLLSSHRVVPERLLAGQPRH